MHRILCWTILLLFIPIYELLWGANARMPTPVEYVFMYLILQTIFLSIVFWRNPVRHSWTHRIDAWNVKLMIAISVIYTIGVKALDVNDRFLYVCLCLLLAWAFYHSNHHSSQTWCSHLHIIYHAFLHFVGVLMAIITLS
jgi:hypothetical protein